MKAPCAVCSINRDRMRFSTISTECGGTTEVVPGCESFRLHALAVDRVVMKPDFPAGVPLDRVHHARIERPRVQVKAHCSLAELARIANVMYRIQRIDGDWFRGVNLHDVGRD